MQKPKENNSLKLSMSVKSLENLNKRTNSLSQSYENKMNNFVLDKSENPKITFNIEQPRKSNLGYLCKPPKKERNENNDNYENELDKLDLIKKLSKFNSISEMKEKNKSKKKNVLFSMDVKQLNERRDSQDLDSIMINKKVSSGSGDNEAKGK